MFKQTLTIAALSLAVLASAPLYAGNANPASGRAVRPAVPLTFTYTVPTADEAADMAFMREEEKLARDVYLTLAETWEMAPFIAIAAAEQKHMNAMLRMLNNYQLPDPAAGKLIGEFANPDLQALYDTLLVQGAQSPAAALKVGALIEEVDIEDNAAAIATSTKADVEAVYERLNCGSRNHLRAFARAFTALTGMPYEAQVLDQAAIDAILVAPGEHCGRR